MIIVDTAGVAARDRVDYWHSHVCDMFVPLSVAPTSQELEGRIRGSSVADTRVRQISATEHRFTRRPIDIRRGDCELMNLVLLNSGATTVEQDGRTATMQPGDLLFYDSSRPFTFTTRGNFDYSILLMPKRLIGLPERAYRACTAQPLRDADGVVAVARDLITALVRHPLAGRLDRQAALEQTIVGFATAMMPPAGDNSPSGLTYLNMAKMYITRHLADTSLTPAAVAAACGISVSYLHRLFADDQRGVSAHIREQRLQMAYGTLTSAAHQYLSIAGVGQRCGLSDPAHFSRLFKARFGVSPGELRRSHAPGLPG